MSTVRIKIEGNDRKVGAMVKALAVEISGCESVTGTTKEFLAAHGYYEFHFPNDVKAEEFRASVQRYLPENLANVQL